MLRTQGFTLVETLVYVVLFAIVTGVLASIYTSSLSTDRLARREQDLNEARELIRSRVQDLLQSTNQVSSPASGTASVLTANGAGVPDGPVSLSVTNGILYVDTASAAPAALTSPDIVVSGFTATRKGGMPPTIDVTMTLTAGGGTADVSDTFTTSVTLRYE